MAVPLRGYRVGLQGTVRGGWLSNHGELDWLRYACRLLVGGPLETPYVQKQCMVEELKE